MGLHAGGDRIVVAHNLAIQRMICADLVANCVLAACADLVKVGVTLAYDGFPN